MGKDTSVISAALPLAAIPLAALVLGLVPDHEDASLLKNAWNEGGWVSPVLVVAGVLASVVAGRVVLISSRAAPFALGLGLVPGVVALALTRTSWVQFVHSILGSTHCGPARREVVLLGSLTELAVIRLVGLAFSAALVALIGLSMVLTIRRARGLEHAGLSLAALTLACSLAVSAAGEFTVRKTNFGVAMNAAGPAREVLDQGLARWKRISDGANTLLLAAVVVALGASLKAGSRRDGMAAVVNALVIAVVGVGARGCVSVDARLTVRGIEAEPAFFRGGRGPDGLPILALNTIPLNREFFRERGVHRDTVVGLELTPYDSGPRVAEGLQRLHRVDQNAVLLLALGASRGKVPQQFVPARKFEAMALQPAPVGLNESCGISARAVPDGLEVNGAHWQATWDGLTATEKELKVDLWQLPCVELTGDFDAASLFTAARAAVSNGHLLVVRVAP